MPRVSKSELSLVPPAEVGKLPPPPASLTELQVSIWDAVVRTKPADWFGADSLPLLVAYCKHVSAAAVVDQAIDGFRPEWLGEPDGVLRLEKLTNIRCKHTGKIESLATKMRLTQQARYDAQKAAVHARKSGKAEKRPWEQ